jgi:hypothetical protein
MAEAGQWLRPLAPAPARRSGAAARQRALPAGDARRLDGLHRWKPAGHAEQRLREPLDHGGFVSQAALLAEVEDLAALDRDGIVARPLLDGLTAIAERAPHHPSGIDPPAAPGARKGPWSCRRRTGRHQRRCGRCPGWAGGCDVPGERRRGQGTGLASALARPPRRGRETSGGIAMATVFAEMSMSVDSFAADPSGQAGRLLGWYGNGEVDVPARLPDRWPFRTSDASARYLRESMQRMGALIAGRRLLLRVAGARPGSRSACRCSWSPAPCPRSGRVRMRRCRSPSWPAGVQSAVERAHRIRVAEWQVIRRAGEWTAGSGRCGWPGPARPRPVPAGPGTSGSTGRGSSPRMRSGPVMRCGCAKRDANASWSSCGSSPNVPAHLLPLSATSTTARPLHHARRLSRWLRATAARGVRPSASAVKSRSCSGGRPAELVPDRCEDRTAAPGGEADARFCRIPGEFSAPQKTCTPAAKRNACPPTPARTELARLRVGRYARQADSDAH